MISNEEDDDDMLGIDEVGLPIDGEDDIEEIDYKEDLEEYLRRDKDAYRDYLA